MKQLIFLFIVLLAMVSCNSKPQTSSNEKAEIVTDSCNYQLISSYDTLEVVADSCEYQQLSSNDKLEIEKQFRDMIEWDYKWRYGENMIDILPAIEDKNDSIYIGFDFQKLEITIQRLRNTGFFSETFIDNYKRLITELDRKLRNNELDKWSTDWYPPFEFAFVDPFCHCEDEIQIDSIGFISEGPEKVKIKWFYKPNEEWVVDCDFEKENGHWKISYLSGFDYEEGIKKYSYY